MPKCMNKDAECMKESCHLELELKLKENNGLNKPLITL